MAGAKRPRLASKKEGKRVSAEQCERVLSLLRGTGGISGAGQQAGDDASVAGRAALQPQVFSAQSTALHACLMEYTMECTVLCTVFCTV